MLATLRETIAALRGAGEQEERLRQEAADLQARVHAAEAAEVGCTHSPSFEGHQDPYLHRSWCLFCMCIYC